MSKKVGNFLAPILKVLKITAQLCAPGLRSGMLTLLKAAFHSRLNTSIHPDHAANTPSHLKAPSWPKDWIPRSQEGFLGLCPVSGPLAKEVHK